LRERYIDPQYCSGDLLSSTIFGDTVQGFWSSRENKITFIRVTSSSSPNTWQTYVGYYNAGTQEFFRYFEGLPGTGATYFCHRFGWSAVSGSLYYDTTAITPTYFESGTWEANANGATGYLVASFNSDGQITGTFLGTAIAGGFWDITSQSVTFSIVSETDTPTTQQFYIGYLSEYSLFNTEQAITGYFIALAGTGATADVTEYGWQAFITLPSASTSTIPPTQ